MRTFGIPSWHLTCNVITLYYLSNDVASGSDITPCIEICNPLVMPPTLKKLKGHIALGLSVRPNNNKANVFKFHRWIPHQKIIYLYFFKSGLSPIVELCPFKRIKMKF